MRARRSTFARHQPMTGEHPHRSAEAAAASRRNGARSNGPRSASGKAASARNSRKHGLFSAEFAEEASLWPDLTELAEFTADMSAGRPGSARDSQFILIAAARFAQATRLLGDLRDELNGILASEAWDGERSAALVDEIVRLGRHQRRFRGQRDHSVRQLMAEHREDAASVAADSSAP